MIDLVLHAAKQEDIIQYMLDNGYLVEATDPESGQKVQAPVPGAMWCWWAGSGRITVGYTDGTDNDGNPIKVPEHADGYAAIMRMCPPLYDADKIDGAPKAMSDEGEFVPQWDRSFLAKQFHDAANKPKKMKMGQVNVPVYRDGATGLVDIVAFEQTLADLNVPGHTWAGGNRY